MERITTFYNNTGKNLEVYVEPAAESFTLLQDKKATFKIDYIESLNMDPLEICI